MSTEQQADQEPSGYICNDPKTEVTTVAGGVYSRTVLAQFARAGRTSGGSSSGSCDRRDQESQCKLREMSVVRGARVKVGRSNWVIWGDQG